MKGRSDLVRKVHASCLVAACLLGDPRTQESKASRPATGAFELELTKALKEIGANRDGKIAPEALRARLESVLATVPDAAESTPLGQQARIRLGEIELHKGAYAAAERHFSLVQRHAPQADNLAAADLYGSSLYGLALARELLGNIQEARTLYEKLSSEQAGTRYFDWAKNALARLANAERGGQAGRRAPPIASRLDVDGKPRQLGRTVDAPVLLVFWSPQSVASVERLAALAKVWCAAEAKERLFAIAAQGDVEQVLTIKKNLGLEVPFLTCPGRFVDPLLLDYSVVAIPDAVLVGKDGIVIARDPSPSRLSELLNELKLR